MKPRDAAARFWEKTYQQETGCWIWLASVTNIGYGRFWLHGRMLSAHRVAYELTHGAIPDGRFVLHNCDNCLCVNPAHLYLGTHQQNMADMRERNRQAKGDRHGSRTHPERLATGEMNGSRTHPEKRPRGEKHARAIYTETQVREIRHMAKNGRSKASISRLLGIPRGSISDIVTRRRWKHI